MTCLEGARHQQKVKKKRKNKFTTFKTLTPIEKILKKIIYPTNRVIGKRVEYFKELTGTGLRARVYV